MENPGNLLPRQYVRRKTLAISPLNTSQSWLHLSLRTRINANFGLFWVSYKLGAEGIGYRFLEHITDAEIEAYGSNLEEAFENAGKALEDTMVDIEKIRPKREALIKVEGKDLQQLLYEWLESLIAKQDTDGMLYSKFICKISRRKKDFILEATVSGEKFDPERHEQKTAIKAPTFHQMMINDKSIPIKIHFILDL